MHFSFFPDFEDSITLCPKCKETNDKCKCPHDPNQVYELLLCRVVLGEYADSNLVYRLNSKDILKSPPLTREKKPFDSVVYFKPEINGTYIARAAIYDAGQVYPEYVFRYRRASQEPPPQKSASPQELASSSGKKGKELHGGISLQVSSIPFSYSSSSSSFSSSLEGSSRGGNNESRHNMSNSDGLLKSGKGSKGSKLSGSSN